MNQFQWLAQTRALRTDHLPSRDLWPDIASRLASRRHEPQARGRLPWLAAAATILLGLGFGYAALHGPAVPTPLVLNDAGARWKPEDPRLAGAAIELQAAQAQIRLALQAQPGATYLEHIQRLTRDQQQRLRRYTRRLP